MPNDLMPHPSTEDPKRESTEGAPFVPGSPASPKGWPFMGSPQVVPRAGQRVERPRADAHGSSGPERTRSGSPMVARILTPSPSHSRHSEARGDAAPAPRERPPALYPWNEEPAAERKAASEQETPEELSTLIERSWPDLAEKEEQPPAQPPSGGPERPEIRWSGPWPDLPEASPAESAEAGALLCQWERLTRLHRE